IVVEKLLGSQDLGPGVYEGGVGESRALAGALDDQDVESQPYLSQEDEELPDLIRRDPHSFLLRMGISSDFAVVADDELDGALPGKAERMMLVDAGLERREEVVHLQASRRGGQ